MFIDWYGLDAGWFYPLERSARRRYRRRLAVEHQPTVLIYRLRELDVPGDGKHDLSIAFYKSPPYNTFGRRPEDSPRVHSSVRRDSKHRMPSDDALCLWFPHDPPARKWESGQGLLVLIEIAARHLLFERHWLETGGHRGGVWPVEDAPHGFQETG
ncbi:MAG: hypothetical protein H0V97_10390 [Actinobacteria bacterium]|nr:hypothetical protein [Actinomycetota bacterium]